MITEIPSDLEYFPEEAVKIPDDLEYFPEPEVDEDNSMMPDFIEQLGEDWTERSRMVEKSKNDYEAGKITLAEYTLQTAGKGVAGRVVDVVGAGISGAIDGISFILPDSVEEPMIDAFKSGVDMVFNTEIGQEFVKALNISQKEYNIVKKKYPRAAKNFESVVNIGLVFAPAVSRAKASPVPTFDKLGSRIIKGAAVQQKTKASKNVQDLLFPETPTTDMANRTVEKGVFPLRRKFLNLEPYEEKMINNVRKVPGIKPARSNTYNLGTINSYNKTLSNQLDKALKVSKAVIPHSTAISRIAIDAKDLVKTNTFVASDDKLAKAIILNAKLAEKHIKAHPPTPFGLMQARRAFDKDLRKQMKGIFNADAYSIFSESTKVVRTSLNNLINEKAPSAFVKNNLGRQSDLYTARDMLAPKAAKDAPIAMGNLFKNIHRVIGAKMELNRTAAIIGGASAFGVAGNALAGFTGALAIGGAGLLATATVTSPKTKKALGVLLKYTNQAIQESTNPKMIQQLKIDRALIHDMLAIPTEQETNKEK